MIYLQCTECDGDTTLTSSDGWSTNRTIVESFLANHRFCQDIEWLWKIYHTLVETFDPESIRDWFLPELTTRTNVSPFFHFLRYWWQGQLHAWHGSHDFFASIRGFYHLPLIVDPRTCCVDFRTLKYHEGLQSLFLPMALTRAKGEPDPQEFLAELLKQTLAEAPLYLTANLVLTQIQEGYLQLAWVDNPQP